MLLCVVERFCNAFTIYRDQEAWRTMLDAAVVLRLVIGLNHHLRGECHGGG